MATLLGLLLALSILVGCAAPVAAPATPTTAPVTPSAAPATLAASPVSTPVATSPAATAAASPAPSLTNVPAVVQPALAAATSDLSSRLGVAPGTVTVVSVTSATWADSSLGCPKPGTVYSQVVTPGYRIVLTAGGKTYEYHTGRGATVVSCTTP